jgi:hypothetical protein
MRRVQSANMMFVPILSNMLTGPQEAHALGLRYASLVDRLALGRKGDELRGKEEGGVSELIGGYKPM